MELTPIQKAVLRGVTVFAFGLAIIGIFVVFANVTAGFALVIAGIVVMLIGRVAYWTLTATPKG